MHADLSVAPLRSLILMVNARYGPMTTMAARDLRNSLANFTEMTVQVSKCRGWESEKGTNKFVDLRVKTGTPQGYPVSGVGACGTKRNSSVAWIEVEHTGLVSFFNYQGDKSACTLDNGLKHGSRCIASDTVPSTKASSALTTPRSSSSVSESSSTTSQTAPSSDCSAD
jgi:hypothetical protein